jgi:hypothetical protein
LEIKCPTKTITELTESEKYDVILKDGHFKRKPKGRYGFHTQVQLAMYCTGAKLCKFYVWSINPEERVCIDFEFDQIFLHEVMCNARKFYFPHLLVRIVDDFLQRD